MSRHKQSIILGASVGLVAVGFGLYHLIRHPSIYQRWFKGLNGNLQREHEDWIVDLNSEHSFPASDPPSFSPVSVR
jgi:hypothetical protein